VSLILMYLVVLILVSAVLFGIASFIFGRGERLPPLPRSTTATVLPASGVTGADVEVVKFTQVLRGYKTSEVDWVLDRLGAELDRLRGELAAVCADAGRTEADGGYAGPASEYVDDHAARYVPEPDDADRAPGD
jgi:DivIVA domain-containing protein